MCDGSATKKEDSLRPIPPGRNPFYTDHAPDRHHVPVHLLATLAILAGGLHGLVTKGPTTPVCRAGKPCSAPAQVTLLFRRAGHVYHARSTAVGLYLIALPAGFYTVTTAERIGLTRNIRPARVHVRAGHLDAIDFRIDTGIR
jgi:hypothetical protein